VNYFCLFTATMKPHWQICEQAYRLCQGIVLAGGKFCSVLEEIYIP